MTRTGIVVSVIVGSVLIPGGAALAGQDRTAEAAMAVAQRKAQCPGCEFDFISKSPTESARRGLVTVGVGVPEGGGYRMIMAWTGSRWAVLWEGNGTTRDVESLPGRIAICMNEGGWTNIRKGPGLNYRRVGTVSKPTIKKAFEVRLTAPRGRREGVAWYRISFNGRPAWVQNLRTLAAPRDSATTSCGYWREYWAVPQRFS